MPPTVSAKRLSQSCEWSPVSIDTNTVMPRPIFSGSISATRRMITPSASSRCNRFQHGVDLAVDGVHSLFPSKLGIADLKQRHKLEYISYFSLPSVFTEKNILFQG